MNNDKISIIIPVYNLREEYFIKCIESVINQSYKNLEIIIVDDGAKNNIKQIIDNYAIKDKRIIVIHNEHKGVSKARNVGIIQATGKFIMFLDSDDWLEQETCKKLIDNIEENDMLIFDAYINYNKNIVKNSFCPLVYNNSVLTEEIIKDLELQIIYKDFAQYKPIEKVVGVTWGKFYRREFIINNKLLFHEELRRAEDHIFLLEIFEKKGKYKYINEYLYNYRVSSESAVNCFSYGVDRDFENTLNYIHDFVINKEKIFIKAYYARIVHYIPTALKNDFFHEKNKEKKKEKFLRLDKMLNRNPYKLGIEKVEFKKLNKKNKLVLMLLKHKNILYFIYILNNYKKRKTFFK